VGHQDKIKRLTAYAKRMGIDKYYYDKADEMSRKYGMTYGSGIVFIDKNGIVKKRIPKGFTSKEIQKSLELIIE